MDNLVWEKKELERKFYSEINWFYWIAALSFINIIMYEYDGSYFVAGLITTMIVQEVTSFLSHEINSMYYIIGLIINIIIIGSYGLFGLFGNKRVRWTIILGIIFYTIDTLILLIFFDLFGFIFHVIAIYSLIQGYRLISKIEDIEDKITAINIKEELEFN